MDNEEKKLIEEIRNGLHDFEIPYEEGSWENFQKSYIGQFKEDLQRRRRTPLILWKYVSAAAVLIGLLVSFPWNWLKIENVRNNQVVKQVRTIPKEERSTSRIAYDGETKNAVSSENENTGITVYQNLKTNARLNGGAEISTNGNEKLPPPPLYEGISTEGPFVEPILSERKTASSRGKTQASAAGHKPDERKPASDRWKFGIEVNPSMTTDKPALSAGILTQFEISEKIKLAAGLTYAHIAAAHEIEPVQLSYDTKMVGGKSTIKAIDIPLTIIYEPTDGWYATVGISALAVLDEDKIYRMESEVLRENVVTDPTSGASVSVFEVIKSEYSEKSMDTDFEGRNNLRYLNLSIGKKQRFNKQADLLFEPFIKIPMGGLQRGDINLLNSGIKIKVLF